MAKKAATTVKKCFSCGAGFKGNTRQLLLQYKQAQKDVYFYKLEEGGDIYIVNKKQFKTVLQKQIKPNFKKGAEYAHISEFKG